MLPHLAGDVSEDLVLVLELDLEHGIGQVLDHRGLDLDRFFLLRQALSLPRESDQMATPSTRAPRSVTATENSKCADSEPSAVRAVHPSASTRTSGLPALTIGSIARTIPVLSFIPLPGSP